MGFWGNLWIDIKEFHTTLLIVLTPLLLLILPASFSFNDSIANYAYVLLVMGVYWVSEALPISVTALLPMVLFPILGVMPSDKISICYLKDTNFLLLGGFIIAVAFELSGLHKRFALVTLKFVGPKPRALMFGFMFAAWFLSMWISNTATTTMMMPMVEAVLQELKKTDKGGNDEKGRNHENKSFTNDDQLHLEAAKHSENKSISHIDMNAADQDHNSISEKEDISDDTGVSKEYSITKVALMICVPFGASMGGVATLTGSDTNLILSGTLPTIFPKAPPVSFAQWLVYCFPNSLIMFLLSYVYMSFFYFGLPKFGQKKTEGEERTEQLISKELKALGSMRQDEIIMALVFALTVLLWLLRDPGFVPGWAQWFTHTEDGAPYVSDATVAVTMAVICYMLPTYAPKFKIFGNPFSKHSKSLLDWKSTEKTLPWGVLVLIGGGFALAEASSDDWSGFSSWCADKLTVLEALPTWVICLIVSTASIFLTEITSNTATAALFIPILCQLSVALEVNPYYLTVPATMGCSLAFMLPVATPPNAIAFGYGHLKVIDMVKCGIALNILGVVLINVLINTFGVSYWGLNEYPDWANVD